MTFMVQSLKPFTFLADYSRIWSLWSIYLSCITFSTNKLKA